MRVRLVGAHAVADLTGPTACEVVTADEKRAVEDRLGPDPIRAPGPGEPDARDAFVAAVRRSRSPVGLLPMNQDVVAGVGNIYRAEALFRAGLAPMRPGRDVPAEDLRTVWDDLVVLMRDGARTGAIVTTRPEHRDDGTAPDGTAPAARRPGGGPCGRTPTSRPTPCPRTRRSTCTTATGCRAGCAARPCCSKELAGRNLFWCGVCQT